MTAEMANQETVSRHESASTCLRIVGGLLLMVALLLYFFHLAEAPMGRSRWVCWPPCLP